MELGLGTQGAKSGRWWWNLTLAGRLWRGSEPWPLLTESDARAPWSPLHWAAYLLAGSQVLPKACKHDQGSMAWIACQALC